MSKTCLFATVVSASLIESYKWLSPDSGDEPADLLAQISQQLVSISDRMSLESIESSQPIKGTTTILMVNTLWFDRLVLCLTYCLTYSIFAKLVQQRIRMYQAPAQALDLVQPKGKLEELGKCASAPMRMALLGSLAKFLAERIRQLLAMGRRYPLLVGCSRLYFLHHHDDRIRLPRIPLHFLSHQRYFDAFTALFLRLPIWRTLLSTHVELLPCFLLGEFSEPFEVS